jgi:5-methylcytosine-specific restriction endonuclease McrA
MTKRINRGSPNKNTKRKIFAMYDNRCVHCNEQFPVEELTRDHIIPRVHGGEWAWKNMVPSCKLCNNRRSDKILPKEREEYLRGLAEKHFLAFYNNPEHMKMVKSIRKDKHKRKMKRLANQEGN